MKKCKIFLSLLLVAVLFLALPTRADAATGSGTCGTGVTWSLNSSGTLTISGSGYISSAPWSDYSDSIKSVVIKDGVTMIYANLAFANCTNLTSVTLPDTLTYITQYAFSNCTSLTSITIPSSVTGIYVGAFSDCTSLKSVYITDLDAWRNINFSNGTANPLCNGAKLYLNNTLVSSLTIPDDATAVKDYTFIGCTSLTSVTIPDGVTSIGSSAFYKCTGLKSVDLGNGVTTIGSSAFSGCTGLTSVTIPDSVITIGSGAFNCSGLESVHISSLESWLGITFSGNSSNPLYYAEDLYLNDTPITDLVIPDGTTTIKSYAFYGFDSLTSVTIPDSVTKIGNSAFYNCDSLTFVAIPDSVTTLAGGAFADCSVLTCVKLSSGLTALEASTFYGCPQLAGIVIPAGVESIGDGAFYACYALSNIVFEGPAPTLASNTFYSVTANAYYTADDTWTEEVLTADYGGTITWYTSCADGDHSFETAVTDATCTAPGYTTYTCADCGHTLLDDYVEPVAHDYQDYVCIHCGTADDPTYSGTFTTGVSWLIKDGTLVVYGEGNVPDYSAASYYPWNSYRSSITRLVIKEGITNLGYYAYYNMVNLAEIYYDAASAADMLYSSSEIRGTYAFYNAGTSGDGIALTFGPHVTYIPNGLFVPWAAASSYKAKIASITFEEGCQITAVGRYAFYGIQSEPDVYISGSDLDQWCSIAFENSFANPICYTGNLYVDGALLTEVTLPAGASNGSYTFYNCTSLTSVTISPEVTALGSGAFYNCSGLTEVVLPENLTSLGDRVFSGCTELTSMVIPEGVTELLEYTFSRCTALTEVTLPDALTSIGLSAFNGCTGLTAVELPDALTSIGSSAFSGCTGLTGITIPENVTALGASAFSGCTGLTHIRFNAAAVSDLTTTSGCFSNVGSAEVGVRVTIGASVTEIPAYLFYASSGSNLTSVEFEENSLCETIAAYAFYGNTGLTNLTLPESITTLGNYAFAGCSGLTEMTINCIALNDVSSSAPPFYGAGSETDGVAVTFGSSVTRVPADLFYTSSSSEIPSCITSVAFEDGSVCESIGTYAFNYCTALTTVSLPASLTTIETKAFYNCTALTDVHLEDVGAWCGVSLGDAYATPLRYVSNLYVGGEPVTELVIPEGTEAINSYAFYDCTNLTSLTIPESVTSIGKYAFYDCTGLEEIRYNAVSAADLASGNYTFQNAGSAGSGIAVTIGENVRTIPAYLFSPYSTNVTNLTSVTFENAGNCESVGSNAFYCCSNLTTLNVDDINGWAGISFSGSYANPLRYTESLYVDGQPVTELVIDNAEAIGSYAFCKFTDLTSVTLGDSVKSIGKYAFQSCANLTSLKLGSGMETIGNSAFYSCSALSEVDLGENVSVISEYAFYYCSALNEIIIPESVTEIGNAAFPGSGLSTATFLGAAPATLSSNAFPDTSTVIYYAPIKGGWTEEVLSAFPNEMTLIPYCPDDIHTFTTYTSNGDATCLEDGTETALCDYCGEADTRTDSGSALGHSYSDGVCTRCGHYQELLSGSCGENVTWSLNSHYDLTISGTGDMYDYDAAATDYTVIPWHNYQEKIVSITVEEGVTSVGNYTFENCTALTEVNLANTVTSIGSHAFFYCTKLPEITIPAGVTSIGDLAFYGCWTVTELEIPASVASIGSRTFGFMDALESLTVASGNTHFCADSYSVLYNADKTKVLFAPESLSIDYTIPSTVTVIDDYAFFSCSNVKNLKLPANLTAIGEWALANCTSLTALNIPASVESIGNCAFVGCDSLLGITVEDGSAYYYSDDQEVLYNKAQTRLIWGGSAQGNYVLPATVTVIAEYAFDVNYTMTGITIPAGIKTIDLCAFADCLTLTSIKFLGDAPAMDGYAFGGVTATVYYPMGNKTWTSDVRKDYGGTLTWVQYDPDVLAEGTCGEELDWVLSADGVLTITGSGNMTDFSAETAPWYDHADEIRSVVLENGVTSIGSYAFHECINLESVTISGTVTALNSYSFNCCYALTEITIPAAVDTIGKYAFAYCTELNLVVFQGDAPSIGNYAFRNVTADCHYPATASGWTSSVMANYGGTLTWTVSCEAGHNVVIDEAIPAACTENGLTEGSHCAACGEILTAQTVIEATGHNYEADVTDPTCTEAGCTTHICASCGDSYTDSETAALGHNEVIDAAVPATCTEDGMTEGSHCDRCNEILTAQETIPAAGHTEVIDEAVPVSCTENGLTEGSHCSACGEILTAQTVIEATGHSYEDGVCSNCGDTITHLEAPGLTSANIASTGKIRLSWDAVAGAVKYVVTIYDADGNVLNTAGTTGTSITHSSAAAGVTYRYSVAAVAEDGTQSENSNTVSRCCDLARPTVTVTNVASTGKNKLSWDAVKGATKYTIYIYDTDGNLLKSTTTTKTNATHSTAVAGETYTYKVRARCGVSAATSAYSTEKSRCCDLAQPTITVRNVASSGKNRISWQKVTGAKKYTLYIYDADGNLLKSTTTTATALTHSSAIAGEVYTYKVRALCSVSAATSAYSAGKSRCCDLARPVVSISRNSSGKPVLTWKAITGASKYKVYCSTDGENWALLITTGKTTITNSKAVAGTTYYYKVIAIHGTTSSANSTYSSVVSIKAK